MGGKHLKKLRAEKSKIHLKKKKLPKGRNITDTTFKVKKILTIEQLKTVNKDEPVSNWNVPMKDLLIRLNHYNFTSRLNALCGIKELLTNYPEILQGPSLKSLVSRLLEQLTDDEHKIRVTAMNLLSYLFDLIPASALLPFHDVLNAHLGCAMTHRDVSIQQDSLNFIDVMIKYTPGALKNNFLSIAQNFIRILKRFLIESHGVLSKGTKQDLEKSKTGVLSRFYEFITAGCSGITVASQNSSKSIDVTSLGEEKISLRQSNDQYKKIPELSLLFINRQRDSKSSTLHQDSHENFKSICSLMMPLLFETWIEFCPDKKLNRTNFECVLTERTGPLLFVILKIIMFLYERTASLGGQMESWFVESYASAFKKCFTSSFPYLSAVLRKKSNSSNKASKFENPCSNNCDSENLIICYLSYSFKFVAENSDLESVMENYVSRVLTRKNSTETELLSKVVDVVLRTSNRENTKCIVREVVSAYRATHNLELRRELSKALVRIVLDENDSAWQKEQSLINWMRSLPEHICKTPVFKEEIETILYLINRPGGTEVLREVENKAFEILRILPNFKIHGIPEFEGQKMIANILFRCNDKILEELLKEVLGNRQYSQNLRDYIKNIFCYKLIAQT